MMNNDMLANIEYLREKANVSYEEAEQLLEAHNGNVMRVLVELEHQGRVFSKDGADAGSTKQGRNQYGQKNNDGMQKTKAFFQKAMQTQLIVEKKTDDGVNTIGNVPVAFAVLAALCAPWLAVGTAAVIFATGHTARIESTETKKQEA